MTNARPEERKRKLHITAEKNRLQQRKQWQTGPKANSLHTVESLRRRTLWCCCFPACFARARYSSRMIDRFLNWGDHGKPKSGKIKGRCQPPLNTALQQSEETAGLFSNVGAARKMFPQFVPGAQRAGLESAIFFLPSPHFHFFLFSSLFTSECRQSVRCYRGSPFHVLATVSSLKVRGRRGGRIFGEVHWGIVWNVKCHLPATNLLYCDKTEDPSHCNLTHVTKPWQTAKS